MAIIDKNWNSTKRDGCHFLFYYKIICNVVYCKICTNAIWNTLHIAWNMFNIFKFKQKEAGLCFMFSFVINIYRAYMQW